MHETSLDILTRLRGCYAQKTKESGWLVHGPKKFPNARWISLRPPLVLGDIAPLGYADTCARVEAYHAV